MKQAILAFSLVLSASVAFADSVATYEGPFYNHGDAGLVIGEGKWMSVPLECKVF